MTKKPERKKQPRKRKSEITDVAELQKRVAAYEDLFDDVQHFTDLINRQETDIYAADEDVSKAKAVYDRAKDKLAAAKEARDGTKHALFMFLRPGPAEILPLFDRMEEADEEKHGAHSEEWRKEPVSALKLSFAATNILTAADIIFVGQLQDRIQADANGWWEKIENLNASVAAAITDRLNEFIAERTSK